MTYSPLQVAVFNAAFSGALGGIMSSRVSVDTVAADYAQPVNAALAFATEFDTLYGVTGAADVATVNSIEAVSTGVFTTRVPTSATPSDYALAAAAAIALVQESTTIYAANIPAASSTQIAFTARNVCAVGNVASLAAFTVAGNDGVLNVAGDIVILDTQTTAAQNGPYVVGTVAAGLAPLTRPSWWQTGMVLKSGVEINVGGEGTLYKNTKWAAMTPNASFTVGTNDPQLFPRTFTIPAATFASAAKTFASLPIFSANVGLAWQCSNAGAGKTTVQLAATVAAGTTGITPGTRSTGAIVMTPELVGGATASVDVGNYQLTITNQA